LSLVTCLLLFSSCEQAIDPEYLHTKQQDLITSFLQADPEQYSEFSALLDSTGLSSLLNAYGYYTCFAPTNEAMRAYYAEQQTSLQEMDPEIRLELAQTHLIKGRAPEDILLSARFPDSRISLATMNDVFLNVEISTSGGNLHISVQGAPILILDQEVHNGVVHTVGKALEATATTWEGVMEADARFAFFNEAVKATGWLEVLNKVTDNELYHETRLNVTDASYRIATKAGYDVAGTGLYLETPAYCKTGYTVLRESDETLRAAGIDSYQALVDYAKVVYDRLYPGDSGVTDPKDPRHSLNRFVAYHILDRDLSVNEFIPTNRYDFYAGGYDLYEYLETLCPNTLIEVSSGKDGTIDLAFNRHINSGEAVRIVTENSNLLSINGVCHEIDRVLTYEGVEDNVLGKRLRMDVASLMPELATNKLRFIQYTGSFPQFIIPQNYFKNLTYTESTQLHYIASDGWGDCEGDEFLFIGKYDFKLRIPPVPRGDYEVRIGYTANSIRGVAQIYLDGKPCGIPLDMTITSTDAKIGSVQDVETEDNGVENDKMMRNRGYLKGPANVLMKSSKTSLRENTQSLRRVVATVNFDKVSEHFLRIKSVEDNQQRQFHLDYIELAPKTVWETEGRD
jgi:uncharacterized surface protein with fasciclin (FAS1) repeats